jgi:amidase/aspartyl-tRNA(Asn)/glutamyl-tRNA(Gln) amidotransferase subunit A
MAGFHEGDPFSLPDHPGDFADATTRGIEGMRIAYSPRLDLWPVSREVADVIDEAVGAFRDAGAIVEEVELGLPGTHTELCEVWMREAAVLYAELNETFVLGGVADFLGADSAGIPPQFADMIRAGQPISAVQAKLDDAVRTQVFDALMGCFATYDLLVSPTTSIASIDNGSDGNTIGPADVEGEAVDPLMGWCLTYPFNMTGHPAASIPAGFTADGLPVGMQLIGRRHDEATLLAASAAFEQVRPWADSYDKLAVG